VDEISKKDLLAETGISYGQLYRWKREGLIPEEWFVKRSAFTGQETFFPRERMLNRVRAILALKDGLSLDQIREQLEKMPLRCDVRAALLAAADGDESFVDALQRPARYRELPLTMLAGVLGVCEWLVQGAVEQSRTERDETGRNGAKISRAERLRLVDEALELSTAFPASRSSGNRVPEAPSSDGHASDSRSSGSDFLGSCSPAAVTIFETDGEYHLCLSGDTEPPRFDSTVKVLVHLKSADVAERYRSRVSMEGLSGGVD
jgi:DNA-binding transcriptional MerR regulator